MMTFITTVITAAANFDAMFWLIAVAPDVNETLKG
jgi:hypothetical protein